ncbi:hypothetical protein OHA72_58490 [Dactylosporangium sp. NBC_01737]|uniref:hypothetical protein n=1 Tax=Dactylosporangium sp. NBC_01737 TaxID=2975959 RepID=UPI002E0D4D86|nr:hypothetical protein OHA72_58490 [Dactylosporangium sp. NBC_01737]
MNWARSRAFVAELSGLAAVVRANTGFLAARLHTAVALGNRIGFSTFPATCDTDDAEEPPEC